MKLTLVDGNPIDYSRLPESLRGGMQRYLDHGIKPGSFMMAILTNDLRGACEQADDVNRHQLFEIVAWLYNNAPGKAWGSPDNVVRWCERE